MLDKKKRRKQYVYVLNTLGGVLIAVAIVVGGYIFNRKINPTIDYSTYSFNWNYNTSLKLYDWVIPLLVAICLFLWASELNDAYRRDYIEIRQGEVVGHYSGVSGGMYYTDTTYYVTIKGRTKAGETSQYSLSISPTTWSTIKIGDRVNFT